MTGPQVSLLPDGRRLHLHHGPIDLIVEAFGAPEAITRAYRVAAERFDGLLAELVAELHWLRSAERHDFSGIVARRMASAIDPFKADFVTPMASVAGAVADEICTIMAGNADLRRLYVNNGGDIALFLAPGERMRAAIASGTGLSDRVQITHSQPVRGIATSGWRGRSWSLGIADSVTVLAGNAASADVAATLIANAVDLPGHPAIRREPALRHDPDSDLGARPVTMDVGDLSRAEIAAALDRGAVKARTMVERGLISGAALYLGRDVRLCGGLRPLVEQDHTRDTIPEREPAYG